MRLVNDNPVEVLIIEPRRVLQNGLVRGHDHVGPHRIQNETLPPLEDVEVEVAHMAEGVAPVEQSALWCKHNGPHGARCDDRCHHESLAESHLVTDETALANAIPLALLHPGDVLLLVGEVLHVEVAVEVAMMKSVGDAHSPSILTNRNFIHFYELLSKNGSIISVSTTECKMKTVTLSEGIYVLRESTPFDLQPTAVRQFSSVYSYRQDADISVSEFFQVLQLSVPASDFPAVSERAVGKLMCISCGSYDEIESTLNQYLASGSR